MSAPEQPLRCPHCGTRQPEAFQLSEFLQNPVYRCVAVLCQQWFDGKGVVDPHDATFRSQVTFQPVESTRVDLSRAPILERHDPTQVLTPPICHECSKNDAVYHTPVVGVWECDRCMRKWNAYAPKDAGLETDEPAPKEGKSLVAPLALRFLQDHGYHELAITLANQTAKGLGKYGTPLRTQNGRRPLKDAKMEVADQFVYLTQLEEWLQEILTTALLDPREPEVVLQVVGDMLRELLHGPQA